MGESGFLNTTDSSLETIFVKMALSEGGELIHREGRPSIVLPFILPVRDSERRYSMKHLAWVIS